MMSINIPSTKVRDIILFLTSELISSRAREDRLLEILRDKGDLSGDDFKNLKTLTPPTSAAELKTKIDAGDLKKIEAAFLQ